MEETSNSQDDSFQSQTQPEFHLSPEEAENLPSGVQTLSERSEISPVPPRPRRPRLIKTLIISLLVFLLLVAGTSVYAMERPSIPGGSASIHITPDNRQLSKTYTINATLGSADPTLNPVGVHTISFTTPTKSLTVPATGKQQEPATYASGTVLLMDGSSYEPIPVGEYSVYSYSGVAIKFYISSPVPVSAHPYIHAQAMNPGPSGNIQKFDVNDWYNFPNTYIHILNQQPFSGGRNGYTTTVVSQNDISSATSQLTNQLQSDLSADQISLKSQLSSSEQLLDPTHIQCKPSVRANRNPNDQVNDVTVTGSMTCSAIAYAPAKLKAYGVSLLGKDAFAQWGGSYTLAGQLQEKLYNVRNAENIAAFTLDVQGLYVFRLSPSAAAHFSDLVAGQTQEHAQAVLLRQTGVEKVSFQVSGSFGTALPSSPKDIHITLFSGKG